MPKGRILLVGLGPGDEANMTLRARDALGAADVVIGHTTYIKLVRDLIRGKQVIAKGMTAEIDRCRAALKQAKEGKIVALISSGDSGIYGMAGPAFEVLIKSGWRPGAGIEVEVVPGSTAAVTCASLVGAPLTHDFCTISLSDLLTPWPVIAARLEAAARADFVVALYNPRSARRREQLVEAQRLLLRHRGPQTPVAIVTAAYREQQHIEQTTLAELANCEVGMLSTILVGNRSTFFHEGVMITPRGYGHKYRDVTGETNPGEKPGRSLSVGLAGRQATVRRYLRENPAASLAAAAHDLALPLGNILEAIAQGDATEPTGEHRAIPVEATPFCGILKTLQAWGWLRAALYTDGGASAELLIQGEDLHQIGGDLKVVHERFTFSMPWNKVAAVWLVTEGNRGYGASFLDDRNEPVCEFWLADGPGKGDATALARFLEAWNRLAEVDPCVRSHTQSRQPPTEAEPPKDANFSVEARDTLYRIMGARRDMRHFRPGATVEPATLRRIYQAAQMAPSVGLMQPWRLIRLGDGVLRAAAAALVDREREQTAEAFGKRRAEFLRLKVEGIRDCAELLAVVQAPDDGTLLGRRTLPEEMALCSTACAVQNMWLAARAENLGLGWVSFFDPIELAALLKCPRGAKPIALLCLGPVDAFYSRPMLEEVGWRQARPLRASIFENYWAFEAVRGEHTDRVEPPG